MRWSDEGIVLSLRPHGETSAIVEVFTRLHGRYFGLVRGGRSKRLRPVLQPGNGVRAEWRARLPEHLGFMTVELGESHAARVLDDPLALCGLGAVCALARLVPERDPHPGLFEGLAFTLGLMHEARIWPALVVRWELELLNDLGFGLDLSKCAATGSRADLVYVSPKSGRAVSAAAGSPFADRLLGLPGFLLSNDPAPPPADIIAGLELTGYFIERHVLAPHGLRMPEARMQLIRRLSRLARMATTAASI